VINDDFWIDAYSSIGAHLGTLKEIQSISLTERLNQIGEVEFTVPAILVASWSLSKNASYIISHATLGLIGTYYHADQTIDADQQLVTIRAQDSLIGLANRIIGFGTAFNNQPITTMLTTILTAVSFTATYETGYVDSNITLEFWGENYIRGLDVVRQYLRGWFRRESDFVIKFGTFSATTPVIRLMNVPMAASNPTNGASVDYAIITALKRDRRGSAVVNRVFPFGAGLGETKIDLSLSDRTTPYTITTLAFVGGEVIYYIEDTASVLSVGPIERALVFSEIRPITNSAADLLNAANAVYDMAAAFLTKYKAESDVYTLSCVGLPYSVKVGDLIRVDFNGVGVLESGAVSWLNLVNQKFFITQLKRTFGDGGAPIAELTVSANGEEAIGSTEVLYSILEDVSQFKIRPQPTMSYYTKSSPTLPIDPTRYVEFKFYIGGEVLAINEMKVEFQLMPLRSYTSTVATATISPFTSSTQAAVIPTTTVIPVTTQASASGGGTTVSSANNAAATTSSVDYGGAINSSSTSPSSVPVSGNNSGNHTHGIIIRKTATGGTNALFIDGGLNFFGSGLGADVTTATQTETVVHTHTVTIPAHAHSVTIPAHAHSVVIPVHNHNVTPTPHTHSIDIPSHSHTLSVPSHSHTITIPGHTHAISFGVIDDTLNPTNVTVTVNTVGVSGISKLEGAGSTTGTTATGPGTFLVDILSTILATGDFRNKTHVVRFDCGSNQGQCFAQLLSRVTIQPIAT